MFPSIQRLLNLNPNLNPRSKSKLQLLKVKLTKKRRRDPNSPALSRTSSSINKRRMPMPTRTCPNSRRSSSKKSRSMLQSSQERLESKGLLANKNRAKIMNSMKLLLKRRRENSEIKEEAEVATEAEEVDSKEMLMVNTMNTNTEEKDHIRNTRKRSHSIKTSSQNNNRKNTRTNQLLNSQQLLSTRMFRRLSLMVGVLPIKFSDYNIILLA